MKKLFVINGPNINFTGIREVEVYGSKTYNDLVSYIKDYCKSNNVKVKVVQSNCEGVIIDYIQEAYLKEYDGIILNAGAYTHYSLAIRDAISSIPQDVIEVHLSDTSNREDFRKENVIRDVCSKTFEGKLFDSYIDAIKYLISK